MKTFALALTLASAAGCGAIGFDVSQPLSEQMVQGSPLGALLPAQLFNVPFNVDIKAETQKHGTGPASAAYLGALSFAATRQSGSFDFIDEIHIYVEATSGSANKQEIANLKPVPKGQTTINMNIVSPKVDLLPYINSGAAITASASGHEPASDFYFSGLVIVNVRI